MLINAHLESGSKKKKERIFQANQIISSAFMPKFKKTSLGTKKGIFNSHDVRIFFGDLNFRIDASYTLAKEAAERFSDSD